MATWRRGDAQTGMNFQDPDLFMEKVMSGLTSVQTKNTVMDTSKMASYRVLRSYTQGGLLRFQDFWRRVCRLS